MVGRSTRNSPITMDLNKIKLINQIAKGLPPIWLRNKMLGYRYDYIR
jgi:hypothetical protein